MAEEVRYSSQVKTKQELLAYHQKDINSLKDNSAQIRLLGLTSLKNSLISAEPPIKQCKN